MQSLNKKTSLRDCMLGSLCYNSGYQRVSSYSGNPITTESAAMSDYNIKHPHISLQALSAIQRERLEKRFWEKAIILSENECWNWQGSISRGGYGRFGFMGVNLNAHRIAYLLKNGWLPAGGVKREKEIDHLCRNRKCVNPFHLEVVTKIKNIQRGEACKHVAEKYAKWTHCAKGHEFTPKNTYYPPKKPTNRNCRKCRAISQAQLRQRRGK